MAGEENLGRAVLALTTDDSGLDKGLSGAERKASGWVGKVGGILGKGLMIGAGVAVAGGAAVTALLGDSLDAAMEAEAITAQLEAVIKSTGGAAGVSADEANAWAQSLSEVTRFEDDAIVAGESMLLTFTNIGEEVFPTATETMLDMSQALGQDLKSSAVQLGKALNDPIRGVTALQRVGVTFTEQQKAQIKAMVEAGDVMGAQKVILAELNKEFGGSARAAGQTLAGQVDILRNQIGNIKEEIGGALLPVLSQLATTLGPVLLSGLRGVAEWFTGTLIPAIASAVSWVTTNWPLIQSTITSVWQQIVAEVGPIINEIVAIVQTVWGEITAFVTNNSDAIRTVMEAAWTAAKTAIETILGVIQGVIAAGQALIRGDVVGFWDEIKGIIETVWEGIKGIVGGAIDALSAILGVTLPNPFAWIEGALDRISEAARKAFDWLQKVTGANGAATAGGLGGFAPGEIGPVNYASGTAFHPGGLALVGEQGPELINLPRGSQVYPTGQTARMLAGLAGAGQGNMTVNLTIHAPGGEPRAVARAAEDGLLRAAAALGIR